MQSEGAKETIHSYYQALRDGAPLEPYFADVGTVVKYGISETLVGYDAVVEGLRDQTNHTTDWRVDSHDLRVAQRECHAWFSDAVRMSWRDIDLDTRYQFDTRWSGTLERRDSWDFVGMHVSVSREL